MKTYNQIHFSKISEVLMNAAQGVSAVTGCGLLVSDMVYALADFNTNRRWSENAEPYYIAIREMGVESGGKTACIDRCKGLGYPLVIAKIEVAHIDYNMAIMFTHGWMDRDDNYMEQEFNSL